jgi:hypothetical protein
MCLRCLSAPLTSVPELPHIACWPRANSLLRSIVLWPFMPISRLLYSFYRSPDVSIMAPFKGGPGFFFFSLHDSFPATEDYDAIWSDYAGYVQPPAVNYLFLGALVSVVSSGEISKVTHVFVSQDVHNAGPFDTLSYGGSTISDVDAADAAVFTSPPVSKIYVEDLISHLNEVDE